MKTAIFSPVIKKYLDRIKYSLIKIFYFIVTFFKNFKTSNWIAFAALIISLISLLKSCELKKAEIVFEKLPEFTYGIIENEKSRTETTLRLLLKNNGEKTVTLERLFKDKKDKGIVGFIGNGKNRNIERNITLQLVNKELASRFYTFDEVDSHVPFDLVNGILINKPIEPGAILSVNIILIKYNQFTEDVEEIGFGATFSLSDNSKIIFYFEIPAKIRWTGNRG